MTELEYAKFVDLKWRNLLTGYGADKVAAALGLAGEAGEVVDLIKKQFSHGKLVPSVRIVEELGDVEFYLAKLRSLYGIDRFEVLIANRLKLDKRYPER